MKIVIEDGIQPEPKGNSYLQALRHMQSGQSFKFPIAKRGYIATLCTNLNKGGFMVRKISDKECRVWKK